MTRNLIHNLSWFNSFIGIPSRDPQIDGCLHRKNWVLPRITGLLQKMSCFQARDPCFGLQIRQWGISTPWSQHGKLASSSHQLPVQQTEKKFDWGSWKYVGRLEFLWFRDPSPFVEWGRTGEDVEDVWEMDGFPKLSEWGFASFAESHVLQTLPANYNLLPQMAFHFLWNCKNCFSLSL